MSGTNELWQAKLAALRRFDQLTSAAAQVEDPIGIQGLLDSRQAVMDVVDGLNAQLGDATPPDGLGAELAGVLAEAAHHDAILRRLLQKRLGAEAQAMLNMAGQRARVAPTEPSFIDRQG